MTLLIPVSNIFSVTIAKFEVRFTVMPYEYIGHEPEYIWLTVRPYLLRKRHNKNASFDSIKLVKSRQI